MSILNRILQLSQASQSQCTHPIFRLGFTFHLNRGGAIGWVVPMRRLHERRPMCERRERNMFVLICYNFGFFFFLMTCG